MCDVLRTAEHAVLCAVFNVLYVVFNVVCVVFNMLYVMFNIPLNAQFFRV